MLNKSIRLDTARIYIAQLDLHYIIDTMCSTSYPLPRWTVADANLCCQLYKNFLLLQKKHLGIPLVPSREIDEFWHNHILFTQQYTQDCLNIFGHYLHHQPASPHDNLEKLTNDYQLTKKLYFAEFNQHLSLITTIE